MEYLLNDYSTFGDTEILQDLLTVSEDTNDGYYEGKYTNLVNEVVKDVCKDKNIKTFFLTTGTQTNTLVLSALLRPYEAIISATSAHINTLEAGSIENLGHKILEIPTTDGKICAEEIKNCVEINNDKHRVCPKVVYISQPTEVGTMYSEEELISIKKVCEDNNLLLYLDGARLSVALAKDKNLTLEKYTKLTNTFYFGGTKNGLPLGEMVITTNSDFAKDFKRYMKQNGSLLAKGEFISYLFLRLLDNNKYITLANKSLEQSQKLQNYLENKKITFAYPPQTNQLFIILDNCIVEELKKFFKFTIWEKYKDNKTVIRLVTSFATKDQTINKFISKMDELI